MPGNAISGRSGHSRPRRGDPRVATVLGRNEAEGERVHGAPWVATGLIEASHAFRGKRDGFDDLRVAGASEMLPEWLAMSSRVAWIFDQ